MRSTDALTVHSSGVLRGFFPAGEQVFPVGRDDVITLDAIVREVVRGFRVVPATTPDEWAGLDDLTGWIRRRWPAFERGPIDPGVWIPDVAEVAAAVDHEHWPVRPPVVYADISDLVLLAALCAVGPAAEPVSTGPLPWRGLGGFGEDEDEVDPGDLPQGAVVVRLSIHDDTVDRLEYAVTPDGAYLAVALPTGHDSPG
ncbi:hypothetical protein [Actinoplanes sichuanensis]|uniref:Uncharacterized protein n=1 Tax=Actinoplanes sichuanensis TaxID=512349 RepID=A0ABW4A8A2_9ACTN|nr:hypothetical protein [Actinoplanes sichuanensis]